MAKKGFIKDLNNIEILPITRGELVLDSSGKLAFHSNEFLATNSLPGLISPEEKIKLSTITESIIDSTLSTTSVNPVQNKVVTVAINEAKQLANDALETANNVSENISKAQQIINSIKESYLKSATVDGNVLTIVDLSDSEITFTNTTYNTFLKETAANTGGRNGLVPKPDYNNGSTNRFLKEDGTWGVPEGTGGNYVTLDTAQTITGAKVFTYPVKIKTENVPLTINRNSGNPKIRFSIESDTKGYFGFTSEGVPIVLLSDSSAESEIYHRGNLTKLSQLTDDVVAGKYLPLTGGTLKGDLTITSPYRLKLVDAAILFTSENYKGIRLITPYKNLLNELAYYDGSTWYKIWHAGNGGPDSGLDADTLDGLHASNFATINTRMSIDDAINELGYAYPDINNISMSGSTIVAGASTYKMVLLGRKNKLWFKTYEDSVALDWKTIAFTDSDITGNAATATHASTADKLKTSVKLWGLDFDGSADVSGDMTDVGNITIPSINIDRFITFKTANTHNWRIGYLGTGAGNANYLVFLSSLKNNHTDNIWTAALKFGCETLNATFASTVIAPTFQGNLDGTYVNKLTGYSKATEASDLIATDTLNVALGKLEYKSDIAYSWYRTITLDDTDEIINKWDEVVDFVNGLETDLTDEFVTRKTDLTITGEKIFSGTSASILTIDRDSTSPAWIKFAKNGTLLGYLGVNNTSEPYFNTNGNSYKILHEGNYSAMIDSKLSYYYKTNTANTNTTEIALDDVTAINNDANRWNNPNVNAFMVSNYNLALAIIVGGTNNNRKAMILVGHSGDAFAENLGDLYLNKLGGSVYTGAKLYVGGTLANNEGRFNYGLAYYNSLKTSETGTIVITLPNAWSESMNTYEIDIYEYLTYQSDSDNIQHSKLIISCYNFKGTSGSWHNYGYLQIGSYNKGIRLAYDGSKCCILLGKTTSTWVYPLVHLSRVITGLSNCTSWSSGYSIKFITDESSYSKIVTVNRTRQIFENVVAKKFVTSGGTASQFLKADGSVDSNIYATTSSLNNYVTLNTAQTITGEKTIYENNGDVWSFGGKPYTYTVIRGGGWAGDLISVAYKYSTYDKKASLRVYGTAGKIEYFYFSFNNATAFRINTNSVLSAKFITTGGTADQFVKGDGSLDSTVYLTSASLTNYVTLDTAQTITGTKTFSKTLYINGDNTTDTPLRLASNKLDSEGACRILFEDKSHTFQGYVMSGWGSLALSHRSGKQLIVGESGILYSYNSGTTKYKIWHEGNDGASSGLDADLLDGLHSTKFARSYGGASVDTSLYGIGYDNSSLGSTNLAFAGGFISATQGSYGFQLIGNPSRYDLCFRSLYDGIFSSWKQLAFIDSDLKQGGIHEIKSITYSSISFTSGTWYRIMESDVGGVKDATGEIVIYLHNAGYPSTTKLSFGLSYSNYPFLNCLWQTEWSYLVSKARIVYKSPYSSTQKAYLEIYIAAGVTHEVVLSFVGTGWKFITPVATTEALTESLTSKCQIDLLKRFTVSTSIGSAGFVKTNSSNSYILLGGGGHKLVSDFLLKSEILTANTVSITKNLTLTTEWQETGITCNTTTFPEGSGTYAVLVRFNEEAYYSGIMSISTEVTKADLDDEVLLHKSSRASSGRIYIKTKAETGANSKIYICYSTTIPEYSIKFTFKKLI